MRLIIAALALCLMMPIAHADDDNDGTPGPRIGSCTDCP